MLPDRVSNPGPLTYESGALPIALRCPAGENVKKCIRMGRTRLKLSFVMVKCWFYARKLYFTAL